MAEVLFVLMPREQLDEASPENCGRRQFQRLGWNQSTGSG